MIKKIISFSVILHLFNQYFFSQSTAQNQLRTPESQLDRSVISIFKNPDPGARNQAQRTQPGHGFSARIQGDYPDHAFVGEAVNRLKYTVLISGVFHFILICIYAP